jgi:hypothetical protein
MEPVDSDNKEHADCALVQWERFELLSSIHQDPKSLRTQLIPANPSE